MNPREPRRPSGALRAQRAFRAQAFWEHEKCPIFSTPWKGPGGPACPATRLPRGVNETR